MPSPAVSTFLNQNGLKLKDCRVTNKYGVTHKFTPEPKKATPKPRPPPEPRHMPTINTKSTPIPTKNYSISINDNNLIILKPSTGYNFLIGTPIDSNNVEASLAKGFLNKGIITISLNKNQQVTIDPYSKYPDIIKNE